MEWKALYLKLFISFQTNISSKSQIDFPTQILILFDKISTLKFLMTEYAQKFFILSMTEIQYEKDLQ